MVEENHVLMKEETAHDMSHPRRSPRTEQLRHQADTALAPKR